MEVQGKSPDTVIIEASADDQLVVRIGDLEERLEKRFDVFEKLLQKLEVTTIQSGDKIINIQNINEASFDLVTDRTATNIDLPDHLDTGAYTEDAAWTETLVRTLTEDHRVRLRNRRPLSVFEHYGWMIEVFQRKMIGTEGKKRNLASLAFMVEAYQSSLRFFYYIQLSKAIQQPNKYPDLLKEFFQSDH